MTSPVQITDWMPTFCALAGYKPEKDLKWDGADLSRLLMKHEWLPDRPIYTVGPSWRAVSLRYGDWKLIVHGEGEKKRLELFNIAEDPREMTNRADSEPMRVAAMLEKRHQAARSDRDSVVP